MTAAQTTGPAKQPLPASSHPASIQLVEKRFNNMDSKLAKLLYISETQDNQLIGFCV